MARGSPDYNVPDYTFFNIETPRGDIVAERLGFSRLDNRGRIVYMDDFRNGLHRWLTSTVNGADDPVHVYQEYRSIGYHGSIKLNPVVNSGVSQLSQQIILPTSKKMGIEVGFYAPQQNGDLNIYFAHKYSDTITGALSMKINGGTGNVTVVDGVTTRTVLETTAALETLGRPTSIKMVGDFSTDQYVRVMIGNTQYDLSAYNMGGGVTGLQGVSNILFTCQGISAVNLQACFLEYVIISSDEP